MSGSGANGLWDVVAAAPEAAGVFLDFDGTLAPIVSDPDRAELPPGMSDLLGDLADRLGVLAVVSGRPVDFVRDHLPPAVAVVGLYGLEQLIRGERLDHEASGVWREVVDHVTVAARGAGPEGMRVEPKGLSVTLHYREHPEVESEVRRIAETQSARSGLVLRDAKMSIELHPPIDVDKGSAIQALLDRLVVPLRTVVYAGDDLGDLPAFEMIARHAEASDGGRSLGIAVGGEELPAEVAAAADVVVAGPAELRAALEDLRDRLA